MAVDASLAEKIRRIIAERLDRVLVLEDGRIQP